MATLNVPIPLPSPAEDAESLRRACQGWGTDETVVIGILAHRDAYQRKLIMQAYEELYKESLIKRLESELSGGLEKALYRWNFDPIERQAILAHVTEKKGVDYPAIIEIACINSPEELLAVKRAYQTRYECSLEEDIASHTNGDIRKLLVALVGTYRYDGEKINATLAESEAKIFHDAIKEKAFNHEDIIRILGTRSKTQLNATFKHYKDVYGVSITKDLTSENPNEVVSALRIAIRCITSPMKYFGKVLCHAMDKQTDEDTLTRVIVCRAEKDLSVIKDIYEKRTTVTLAHAVGKGTAGHYKEFLLALIGN